MEIKHVVTEVEHGVVNPSSVRLVLLVYMAPKP
jgi:hypothetical protein